MDLQKPLSCVYFGTHGIPGSGKSEFLDALAVRMARLHDWKFAFFSPENLPISRHISKIIEKIKGKPFAQDGKEERRMTIEDVKQSIGIMKDYFFFIYPEDKIQSIDTILEKARVTIFRYGTHGIVIDPWNELEHLYGNLTEAQYLSRELTKLRRFARINQVHVWVIAHPKNLVKDKSGDYRPPTMYEISGGAHWRNNADNGICIHRPDYSQDETEVFIQKIRFKEVGKIGKAPLIYVRDTGEYLDKTANQERTVEYLPMDAATACCVGLLTEIQAFAAKHDIEIMPVHTANLNKFATISGRASKADMIMAARDRRYNPQDDNEAGACLLFEFALNELIVNLSIDE